MSSLKHLNTEQFATSVALKRGVGVTRPLPIPFYSLLRFMCLMTTFTLIYCMRVFLMFMCLMTTFKFNLLSAQSAGELLCVLLLLVLYLGCQVVVVLPR
jgi:hypothetical protein